MGIRDQLRSAYYGSAVGTAIANAIGLPVIAASDTDYSAANPTLVLPLRPYVLQKFYLAARRFTAFWYFGRVLDALGRVIPGTERLSNYPLRMYDDAGNGGYGGLILGLQGAQTRMVVDSGRVNLATTISNTNAVGTGISTGALTDFSIASVPLASATWAALTTTKGDLVPTTASDQTLFAGVATGLSTLNMTGVSLDGTTTPKGIYLNWIIDDATQGATADNNLVGEILLQGVIEVSGSIHGDI